MNLSSARWLTGAILIGSAITSAHAESLGTYGASYRIKERDAIAVMKEAVKRKLANGGEQQMIKGAQDRYIASLNDVDTPKGITLAKTSNTRFVDLTETVKENYTDGQGRLIVAAGTRINPLQIMPLTYKLFFIDAKDERQLQLVKTRASTTDKIILLGGSVFKAGEFLKRRVYLDIPGLNNRMMIKKLPSIVTQSGNVLQIEEVGQ
jgi:conjugal transfer pilus assembly protein TraW